MITRYRFAVYCCIVGMLAAWCFGCTGSIAALDNAVCFEAACFDVEIARVPVELARGLQGRKTLPAQQGMLFIFPSSDVYPFWMKDTLLPLDIIWLDEKKRVVHIAPEVPPCGWEPCPTYGPAEYARFVLEINTGAAERFDISVGDTAVFRLRTP